MVQPLWKTVWRFLKKLKIELPYDPATPLLDIYLEKTIIQKDTKFTAALFAIARTWEQLKCSPYLAFIVCRLFNDGHYDWCEVISHGSFDFPFSNNERCWTSFHVLYGHLYVFSGEMSICIGHPFFDWDVCFFFLISSWSYLYILEVNSSLVALLANMFSHSVGCLFILFMVSFAVQKCLIRSCLFLFLLSGGSFTFKSI